MSNSAVSAPGAQWQSGATLFQLAPILILFSMAFLMALGLLFVPLYLLLSYLFGYSNLALAGGAGITLCVFIGIVSVNGGVRWVLLLTLLAQRYVKEWRRPIPIPKEWPAVSIFLPAYNETEQIVLALESLRKLDYPRYDVYVVDDGSTDDTYAKAKPFEGDYSFGSIRVFTKPNGGKWSALNFAYQQSTNPIIMTSDADGGLDSDALKRIVARLVADPRTVAVAGFVRVLNANHNLLTMCQALEYTLWSGALRIPQSVTGSVLCMPGPLAVMRRSALEEISVKLTKHPAQLKPGQFTGPFEGDTFAEDFDVTISLLQLGGRVEYEPLAGCRSDAPTSVFDLMSQRYRWARGSMQVLRKYFQRRWNFGLRNGALHGWLMYIYVLDIVIFAFAVVAQMVVFVLALTNVSGVFPMMVAFFAYQMAFRTITSALMVKAQRTNSAELLAVPLLDVYGVFVLGGAFVAALYDEIFRARMQW